MALNVRYSGRRKASILSSIFNHANNELDRQDLYAHILTTSERIVTHDTFNELRWQRDVFPSDIFILAPGFERKAELFPEGFLEVLQDIHAMQCCRDSAFFSSEDTVSMMYVDNQQAWVQSKLVDFPSMDFVQECVRWAAYLAASMLCCKVWRMSMMPVSTY